MSCREHQSPNVHLPYWQWQIHTKSHRFSRLHKTSSSNFYIPSIRNEHSLVGSCEGGIVVIQVQTYFISIKNSLNFLSQSHLFGTRTVQQFWL